MGFACDVFPNPARRQATVQLPGAGYRLRVCDLLGRPVLSLPPATGPAVVLDLVPLCPGTYFVQADGPAGLATRKLLVE